MASRIKSHMPDWALCSGRIGLHKSRSPLVDQTGFVVSPSPLLSVLVSSVSSLFRLFRFFFFSSLPFPPFLRLFPFPPFFLLFFLDLHKVRCVPLRIQKLVRYARVELERLDALERSEAHLLGAPTPQLAHLRMGARTITTLLSVDFKKKDSTRDWLSSS